MTVDPDQQLTAIEATTFDDLEQAIENGVAMFVEVGNALTQIRDRRLYREGFATFEEYCKARWGISRAHAYRQIEAAQVAELVSPIGDVPGPASESVARELALLKDEPEELQEAWRIAVESHGPKPSARQVGEIVHASSREGASGPISIRRKSRVKDVLAALSAATHLPELDAQALHDFVNEGPDGMNRALREARVARRGVTRFITRLEGLDHVVDLVKEHQGQAR